MSEKWKRDLKKIERRTKKTQGKLIKSKSAERAVPQYSGTPDLDLLETERRRRD